MKPQIVIGLIIILAVILFAAVLNFILSVANMPAGDMGNNNEGPLPETWVYQASERCSVEVPLPPREAPYITDRGEYWRFEENTTEQGNPFFNHVAIAILHNPELGGSGYVAGAVIISCKENRENDDPDELATDYQKYLSALGQGQPEEVQITLTPIRHTNLWGKDVLIVSLEGAMFNPDDEFYILASGNLAYILSAPQHSTDGFVGETKGTIFSNLRFH